MDEIPLYGSTGMEEDEEQWRAKVEHARRQLDTMIRRDWNHPSLIFWSVSNETREEHAIVVQGNDDLIRYAKELDPSRLSVHVAFRWDDRRSCEGRFNDDDVICVNSYPWMGDPGLTGVPRLAEMTQCWMDNLDRLHKVYPNKPILIAEFGYRSLEAVFDNMAGEDVHARVLEAQYTGMSAPYVCGATIWCYADHAWPLRQRRDSPRSVTISPYGVVTRDRKPKGAAYWTTRRMFTNGQKQVQAPGVTKGETDGQTTSKDRARRRTAPPAR
jgi:beta-glucuronidase